MPVDSAARCKVCGTPAVSVATIHGSYSDRDFDLQSCPECGFSFIANPWLDFQAIYDASYYEGRGADPLVDYRFELEHPERSIRSYEWRGVARVVDELVGVTSTTRWLDFGCGNGGLVRYVRAVHGADVQGFDEGSIASMAAIAGVPIVTSESLEAGAGSYDVVTAIEVLEHMLDPIAELKRVRRLLKPGGLLFLTTGNAAPFAGRLDRWRYVIPEIHISYFEPRTLERALTAAGFRPERIGRGTGWQEILKYKVLKNLRVRRVSPLTRLLPAAPVAAVADRYARLSEHPIGWAA